MKITSTALYGLIVASLTLVTGTIPSNAAGVLFGLQDGNANMVTVDPLTGVVTDAFALPAMALLTSTVAGLSGAEGGTTLIYTNNNPLTPLQILDPMTGVVLSTHPLNITDRGGLSYESQTLGPDLILSINNGNPLIQQQGYGGATAPAGRLTPSFPGALGGDDFGRHFIRAGGLLLEIDENGAVVNTGANNLGTVQGLAFDGTSLFAANSTGMIFTLNPDTFEILNSVNLTGGNRRALVGLGVAIPEPSHALLALLGITAIGLRRRRK